MTTPQRGLSLDHWLAWFETVHPKRIDLRLDRFVAVLDTLSGERTGHRADERFPMCSTFKLLAAAAALVPQRAWESTVTS